MNEELDSQLSAMFDNELPAAECELLARRLSRDEELKARWGRYAAIGATIRAEGGPRLSAELARRVSVAISAEPPMGNTANAGLTGQPQVAPVARPGSSASKWWAPIGGVAVAASVAAAAILWVRFEQETPVIAQTPPVAPPTAINPSYVVPKTAPRRSIVPSTQLANY